MRQTGVVRRLDDIGRIFIPKTIRKELGFDENDEFEVFVDEDESSVTFKKVANGKKSAHFYSADIHRQYGGLSC